MKKRKNEEKYAVSRCHGKRYAMSAVPSMQRLLNDDYRKQKQALNVHQQTMPVMDSIVEIINLYYYYY